VQGLHRCGHHGGQTGAGDAPPGRWVWLITPDGDVPDRDARDIGDRVGWPGLEPTMEPRSRAERRGSGGLRARRPNLRTTAASLHWYALLVVDIIAHPSIGGESP
jgi:hypothetical protein